MALLDLDRRPGRRRVGAARGPRRGRGGLHRCLGEPQGKPGETLRKYRETLGKCRETMGKYHIIGKISRNCGKIDDFTKKNIGISWDIYIYYDLFRILNSWVFRDC